MQSSYDVFMHSCPQGTPTSSGKDTTPNWIIHSAAAPSLITDVQQTNIAIPTFYSKKTVPKTEAQKQLMKEARNIEIAERLGRLVDTQKLWEILLQNRLGAEDGTEAKDYDSVRLTYERFRSAILSFVPEECFYPHNILGPRAFLQFERDEEGAVSAVALFTYIAKKVLLYKLRMYMETESCPWEQPSRLTQVEFQHFLEGIVPHLRTISNLEQSFRPYWLCHAARKVFCMLDLQRRGFVYIDDIMQSDVFAELLKLYEVDIEDAQVPCGETPSDLEGNWFCQGVMLRVFNHYGELDEDRNGMLSLNELSKYNNGCFTKTFLSRIFEVHPSYENEIDFARYLDFVIATENLDTTYGQRYVWRALDLGDLDFLSRSVLRVFCVDVANELRSRIGLELHPEDMVSELFDMVHPAHSERMTLKDITSSGMANVVLSIMIDHHEFYMYDNRENAIVEKAKSSSEQFL